MPWGRGNKCKALAARFVAAVNAHDADAMRELVTEDFTYIDSWREGVTGRDIVLEGTRRLFASDPGFAIEVESMSYSEPFALLRGWVNSANPEVGRRRAVWRARCEDGLIAEWQAWAEGKPPPLNRTFAPEVTIDMSDRAPEAPEPN
jgi:ketosteroid isomerase-like protein